MARSGMSPEFIPRSSRQVAADTKQSPTINVRRADSHVKSDSRLHPASIRRRGICLTSHEVYTRDVWRWSYVKHYWTSKTFTTINQRQLKNNKRLRANRRFDATSALVLFRLKIYHDSCFSLMYDNSNSNDETCYHNAWRLLFCWQTLLQETSSVEVSLVMHMDPLLFQGLFYVKPKFHLARYVRRVESMHFGCVGLVEQHGSTHSTRRARQARLATLLSNLYCINLLYVSYSLIY